MGEVFCGHMFKTLEEKKKTFLPAPIEPLKRFSTAHEMKPSRDQHHTRRLSRTFPLDLTLVMSQSRGYNNKKERDVSSSSLSLLLLLLPRGYGPF